MANLRVSELDFDTIKNNLKTFLKNYRDSNNELVFTDYDFEGSALSVLLDLLSYNTHYNAYLANMMINEMFLDSAVRRSSAASIAKHLGYTTRSVRSARAIINFEVQSPTGNPTNLTLNKYTSFTTTINNTSYNFVNLQAKTIASDNGNYRFTNIEITEGIPLEYTFIVNIPGPAEKYELPNDEVDTSTLIVTVQNSNADTTTFTYTLADDSLGLDGTSKVYFLEESPTGRYQIVFGDGVIGKKLVQGNLVTVQYLISSGTECNVSNLLEQTFSSSEPITGGSITNITTVSNSNYGAIKEAIDEIKFRAPKFSSSQNRAVTSADYKAIIDSLYPALVDSVSVWGGDENVPKKYGKVMISLSPASGFSISENVKNNVTEYLKSKRMLSLIPEYVDPDFIYINLSVNVKYNFNLTTFTADEIKDLVVDTINNYFNENLKKFDQDFIYSRLSKLIDNTDSSIVGNLIALKVQKRIDPITSISTNFSGSNALNYNLGIMPGTLQSTRFSVVINNVYYPAVLKDTPDDTAPNYNGTGTLSLINPIDERVLLTSYGTIDYGTGTVSIPSFNIDGYYGDSTDVRIMVTPQNSYLDIVAQKNEIILLDDSSFSSVSGRELGLTVNTIAVNA